MSVEKIWTTEAGFVAAAAWNDSVGFRLGYVGTPASHTLYNVEYMEPAEELGGEPPETYFKVHGGITFSGSTVPALEGAGPEDLWWFGFDCGHAGDGTMNLTESDTPIRSLKYVMEECESLARQLAEVQ